MKFEFSDIGLAALFACVGACLVIGHLSNADRRKECDKRGGVLAKVDDSWDAEKRCVVEVKP